MMSDIEFAREGKKYEGKGMPCRAGKNKMPSMFLVMEKEAIFVQKYNLQ